MRKRSLGCMALSLILALGCFAGCGEKETPGPDVPDNTPTANYTVKFDVGAEASAAGVKTPADQTVKKGSTAVEPAAEYEADSTWWQTHELVGWTRSSADWDFSNDKVTDNMTLTAQWQSTEANNTAADYEAKLGGGQFGWVQEDHLYVHYLKGSDDPAEHGTVNPAKDTHYDTQIDSAVYGDWGLWVWEYNPVNSEGRAFYPAFLDESGAVYDIDLTATYNDAGWDSAARENKGITIDYKTATWLGIQLYSQDSRLYKDGFWLNDGGDNYIDLSACRREDGSYHWFVRQGEVQSGSPKYESFVVFDPYAGLEPGSAVTQYDVVSNQGNNNVYVQQKVAEGWDEDSVGYEIFMASFADSDGDGMGDLKGITSKLDYLKELGVDVLWLTPFQQSNSYHGYDIRDYFTVDPRFGTLADYRELLTEAHSRGMKVLMDFVYNHTSTGNPWFIKSQKLVKETVKLADGSYRTIDYRNFYTWQNGDYTPKDELEQKQWFEDPNGYYYYSSFNSSMPELNFDYQATRDAILDVALYWMSFGLDGFRLDAVKHAYMENENPNHSDNIIKDISDGTAEPGATAGDYSTDFGKAVHFFLEFNAKLKASYPSAFLVGENFNGDPIKLAQLYPGLDSQFNFTWYYDTTGSLGTVADPNVELTAEVQEGGLQNEERIQFQFADKAIGSYSAALFDFSIYRTDYIDGIFTSNHDVERARERLLVGWGINKADWVSRAADPESEEDFELSGELAKLYGAMCLSVPGITWIYGGDEIGMFGRKTLNAEGEGAGHEDRWLRQPMKWSKEKSGDKANCEYEIGFNNYVMTWDANNQKLDGVKEQKEDENSIYQVYKDMIKVRHDHPTLARGTVENKTLKYQQGKGAAIMVYEIKDADHKYVVLVNATNEEKGMQYSLAAGAQLIYSTTKVDGKYVGVPEKDGGVGFEFKMPARTFALYQLS